MITKWKLYSNKFKNTSALDNIYDYKNNLILREYRNLFVPVDKNNNLKYFNYIIWANDENFKRMKKSNHVYIGGTFHHPMGYKQLIILM